VTGGTRHTRQVPHPRRSQRPTGVSPLFSAEVSAATGEPLSKPLAARVRPRDLEEFVGQPHLVGPGRVLRKAIDAGQIPSMILWGPPGTGKTTLAAIAAHRAKARFVALSAVSAGVADLRRVIEEARELRRATGERTVMFIDEIHRFNKGQQDAVLPFVEEGDVTLIGATTENPSFEVISALLSRSRVFVLQPLGEDDVRLIVERALADPRGLNGTVTVAPDALGSLVVVANGDARVALNTLELASDAAAADAQGIRHVDLAAVKDALQRRSLVYDRAGDSHYDTISAFIKSLRGSDPDAALYWLVRMIDAGEDPMFIARRLVILAAEDVGLADPQALVIAAAAQQAVHLIGLPEGYFPLAEASVYLALAPKSDSIKRAAAALNADIEGTRADPVPLHLRNAVTGLMRGLGYGKGYKNAHAKEEHFDPEETFLPESLRGRRYYEPTDLGAEAALKSRVDALRRSVTAAGRARTGDTSGPRPASG
jgi:putative ATPase